MLISLGCAGFASLPADRVGKRREVDWTALSGSALLAFDTSITTRGYTGHEMLDPVGLVHMNGRVYDAELGRFLSADPNIQDVENFQNWNRYTYVLNNPLSYTDPSGFFFSKIFKAIGNFFKSVFKAIGSVFKALLKIPLIRAAIQIVACAPGPWAVATCAAAAVGLALAAGGSISDALMAGAMSIAQMGVWTAVGSAITGPLLETLKAGAETLTTTANVAYAITKGAIHGVVGGAISVAQGGNFMEGFAANAIGAAAGVMAQGGAFGFAGDGNPQGMFMRTAAAAAAGGAAAVAAGGKFANGALTAAMAHLYNAENAFDRGGLRPNEQHRRGIEEAIGYYESRGFEIASRIGVRVVVPGFKTTRVYDFLIRDPSNGKVIGVEVKTTYRELIRLNRQQVLKDAVVATQGANGGNFGPISGVSYAATCFGCKAFDIRSNILAGVLKLSRIPFERCDTPGSCTRN